MYHRSFPPCPIEGPVHHAQPFSHMATVGAVPRKCVHCQHLFEGECLRAGSDRDLKLDHGPCRVKGPTDPVRYDGPSMQPYPVTVPLKCAGCTHLAHDVAFGPSCTAEPEIWGGFRRSLDWGDWRPTRPIIPLGPDNDFATDEDIDAVARGDQAAAIRSLRRARPRLTFGEARAMVRVIAAALSGRAL